MLTACGDKDAEYDASGVFETTEVIVSAKGTGEIVSLNIEEGQTVKADQLLGELDMTQLTLKRQSSKAERTPPQAAGSTPGGKLHHCASR